MERDPIAQKHLAKIQTMRGTYDAMGNRLPPPNPSEGAPARRSKSSSNLSKSHPIIIVFLSQKLMKNGFLSYHTVCVRPINDITVNSRFKKDLNLQIHLHKAFFSDDRFLDSYHKSFLNQTTFDLRKEK